MWWFDILAFIGVTGSIFKKIYRVAPPFAITASPATDSPELLNPPAWKKNLGRLLLVILPLGFAWWHVNAFRTYNRAQQLAANVNRSRGPVVARQNWIILHTDGCFPRHLNATDSNGLVAWVNSWLDIRDSTIVQRRSIAALLNLIDSCRSADKDHRSLVSRFASFYSSNAFEKTK